jgi:polysaccharide deacetylase family protein (PEP-CTERM system associated)
MSQGNDKQQPGGAACSVPAARTALASPGSDRGSAGTSAAHQCVRDQSEIVNALTVDVEDYFHVQAFANVIDRTDWEQLPPRVEHNTDRLLLEFADAQVKATFFTLGWVAERHPKLIRRIVSQGHEVASHGYAHIRADRQSPGEFRADVRRAKQLLEDAGGVTVQGYRAATFSIGRENLWAFEILAEEGHRYSSSVFPIRHDLYGMPRAPRTPFQASSAPLTEIPLTTVRMFGRNFPCSGGGYFRLLPYQLSSWAMRRVNHKDRLPCIFYLHPWEIDPDQPRQRVAPLKSRLRHYTNLAKTQGRLRRLLREFRWARMIDAFREELQLDA